MRKLLGQLSLVTAAVEAVRKNDSFELVIHHTLDGFPYPFEQTDPAISASTFWDEDHVGREYNPCPKPFARV